VSDADSSKKGKKGNKNTTKEAPKNGKHKKQNLKRMIKKLAQRDLGKNPVYLKDLKKFLEMKMALHNFQ